MAKVITFTVLSLLTVLFSSSARLQADESRSVIDQLERKFEAAAPLKVLNPDSLQAHAHWLCTEYEIGVSGSSSSPRTSLLFRFEILSNLVEAMNTGTSPAKEWKWVDGEFRSRFRINPDYFSEVGEAVVRKTDLGDLLVRTRVRSSTRYAYCLRDRALRDLSELALLPNSILFEAGQSGVGQCQIQLCAAAGRGGRCRELFRLVRAGEIIDSSSQMSLILESFRDQLKSGECEGSNYLLFR